MKPKIVVALLCLSSLVAGAQTVEHLIVASQFNNWKASPASGPYSNTNLVAGANTGVSVNPCNYAVGQIQGIPVFAANTPIKIVDPGNPSIDETITPTAITNGGCTATLTTTNAHVSPYYFVSGSFGLQEAINNGAQSGVLNAIELDSFWHAAGGGYATIYNATGSANLGVSDVTITPSATFRWNGSHYASNYTVNGGTITLAAGAAAGTSPTVANTSGSTSNLMTANVTTGTATTTGTLFTETTGTAFPSGMNCTVQSVGANSPPAFTYSTSTTVLTVSLTTAPPVSTPYIFNISCE